MQTETRQDPDGEDDRAHREGRENNDRGLQGSPDLPGVHRTREAKGILDLQPDRTVLQDQGMGRPLHHLPDRPTQSGIRGPPAGGTGRNGPSANLRRTAGLPYVDGAVLRERIQNELSPLRRTIPPRTDADGARG